ncbi:myb-like DNA-binding protein [Thraustotheca clavata]|uniref:Myb-like DNA-binding protein n=1 Tax=Thraustotheca clavata TaxID=74557 RepID=A0A1V9ZGQ2_9STRA|nr:myb-like DNA-binding protein [Thraustotheca clavata]
MNTTGSGTITPKLSAIGKAFLQTSLQDDATGLKRERADSLKQMLPPPPSRRPKAKDKPTPIVTTGLEAIESAPSSLSSTRGGEKSNPRRWSKAEDESLRLAVERSGERNWKAIADQVAGRNHTQCLQRWTKVLKPGLIKGHWTPDEDAKLKTLVAEGRKNWGQVAAQIAGRTSKQCRERWCNHLDPNINKGNYTKEEDDLIIDMQAKLGNRWSVIAQRLVGRTEDAVKIRWKSLMRSRRPKETKEEKNEECSDTSEFSEKPNASSTSGTPLTNRGKGNKTELKPDVKTATRTPNKPIGPNSFLSSRPLASQYPLHAAPGPPRPASFFMPGQSTQAPPVLASNDARPPYPLPPPSASPYLPRTFDNIRPSSYPQQMLPSYMQPPSTSQTPSSFKSQTYRQYASYSSPFGQQQQQQQYDQHHPPLPQHHSQQIPSAFYSQHPGVPPLLPSRLNTPREEWGTSNTPRSQLILNEGQASEYELFHQQRLRLMVKERERHGPALSPAASPGQAMLTKELEANKERQKRQAIMQNGWKNAVVASAEPSELSKPPSEFEEESRYDGFLEKEQNLAEIDPTDEEYTVPLPAVE